MSDKEILEVLKEMLTDYEAALIFLPENKVFDFEQFDSFLESRNIDFGFCRWLTKSIEVRGNHYILDTLFADFNNVIHENGFWFPASIHFSYIDEVKEKSLMPRAQLLKRTIERIEKRILENITVTMPQQI